MLSICFGKEIELFVVSFIYVLLVSSFFFFDQLFGTPRCKDCWWQARFQQKEVKADSVEEELGVFNFWFVFFFLHFHSLHFGV
jgi:hypothetical protein